MRAPSQTLLWIPAGFRLSVLSLVLILLGSGGASAQGPEWLYDSHFMPHRARIGVQVQPMTPELREHFKGPRDAGVLVTRIEPESSAATAGLRVGDIILSAAGEPIRAPFDLVQAVARVEENKALELKILRGGNQQDLSVKPKGRPTPWADPEHWGDWIEKRFHRSGDALRQRLEELERRLEQFERRLDRMSEAEET